MKKILTITVFTVVSLSARADPQTVTLDVPSMNCPMCPITVKKALTQVKGVIHAEISYENKQAVVTFEDSQTRSDALIEATANAGYPSSIVKSKQP